MISTLIALIGAPLLATRFALDNAAEKYQSSCSDSYCRNVAQNNKIFFDTYSNFVFKDSNIMDNDDYKLAEDIIKTNINCSRHELIKLDARLSASTIVWWANQGVLDWRICPKYLASGTLQNSTIVMPLFKLIDRLLRDNGFPHEMQYMPPGELSNVIRYNVQEWKDDSVLGGTYTWPPVKFLLTDDRS